MKNPETKNYDQNDYDGGGNWERFENDNKKNAVYKDFFANPQF